MKKIILFLILTTVMSGCVQQIEVPEKINVVCTIFPYYDWTRQLIGDKSENIELTLLLDNSVNLHSYQPSVDDIMKISTCDLFIYTGGPSDKWDINNAQNPDMITINLFEVLGDAVKSDTEGIQYEDEHNEHSADNADEHNADNADEHIWLSLRNARLSSYAISDALIALDPNNTAKYEENLTAYMNELLSLDTKYQEAVDSASVKTLLFADQFPFRYLADDYGLEYAAAFSGCSGETEASFVTIMALANKIDEIDLHSVMITEGSDGSIAGAVINNTQNKNQQILVMNSMQTIDLNELQNGMTYLSIMSDNLEVLKKALGV